MARSRRRSAEPFLWLLFSAGGMVTALVAPVLLLLDRSRSGGSARPTTGTYWRWCSPIASLFVLVLSSTGPFHAAHRFRFRARPWAAAGPFRPVIALWCYGIAVLESERRRVGCCSLWQSRWPGALAATVQYGPAPQRFYGDAVTRMAGSAYRPSPWSRETESY